MPAVQLIHTRFLSSSAHFALRAPACNVSARRRSRRAGVGTNTKPGSRARLFSENKAPTSVALANADSPLPPLNFQTFIRFAFDMFARLAKFTAVLHRRLFAALFSSDRPALREENRSRVGHDSTRCRPESWYRVGKVRPCKAAPSSPILAFSKYQLSAENVGETWR